MVKLTGGCSIRVFGEVIFDIFCCLLLILVVSQIHCMQFLFHSLSGKEKLSKSVASQKWDRLKLVCTQPYNKVCYQCVVFMCDQANQSDIT